MTAAPLVTEAVSRRRYRGLPFGDPSRRRRLAKVTSWIGGLTGVVIVLHLLGVDVSGWFSALWDALSDVDIQYLVVWAFGWSGGKLLVSQSYADAKVRVAEQKVARAAKREAKRGAGDTE